MERDQTAVDPDEFMTREQAKADDTVDVDERPLGAAIDWVDSEEDRVDREFFADT
jgi:hypothetical protein